MSLPALLAVALLVATVAVIGGLVARSRRDFRRANQVVPGVPSTAPPNWAGAHSIEARLHRRLRDAVAALRVVPGLGTVGVEGREAVERHVLALDEHLVAVAALPASVRAEPLAQVGTEVARLEAAIAQLATPQAVGSGLDGALRELSEGLAHLRAARAELDAPGLLPPPGPDTELPPGPPG